ncbi:MAG: SdpI family protein [Proteobacteria bacterium]|nr:SdpI family protein [Pseudomonadota bacterium]
MMDRKSLWIFLAAFLVVTGASFWQLSLLPGWRQVPLGAPHGHNIVSGLLVLAAPVSLLSFLVAPLIQWLAAPQEALPSWRRWSGKWVVSWSVFWVLFQAFELAHSLGMVSLSNLGTARAGSVMIGIVFMIAGNFMPKAPALPGSNSSQLAAWRLSRMSRFAGKLFVGSGLAFVLGGILLPLEYWNAVFLCLMLAAVMSGIWYRFKLGRDRLVTTAPGPSSRANI